MIGTPAFAFLIGPLVQLSPPPRAVNTGPKGVISATCFTSML